MTTENKDKTEDVKKTTPPQSAPTIRRITVDEDDIGTKEEIKAKLNDTTVDIEAVLEEYKESVKNSDDRKLRNVDKMSLSIPLTDANSIVEMSTDVITRSLAKGTAAFATEMEDMTSDHAKIQQAGNYYSAGNEVLKTCLEKVGDTSVLKNDIAGVREGVATVGTKHLDSNNPRKVFNGEEGYRVFATLTSGVRRITLWNSGITLTLRNIPLRQLDKYLEMVSDEKYEYGKLYGAWYYLFAGLSIDRHIIEQILPEAIVSSNYKDWQDTDKLLAQISLQDYQVILWGLACLMYPTGTTVSYVCGNKNCQRTHSERVDLGKLRLNNTKLINADMISHFSEKNKRVDDKMLEEYRKKLNMDESIEFDVSNNEGENLHYKINLKQSSIKDYLEVGKSYNAELNRQADVTNRDSVVRFITYNQNRCYRSWIKSIECKMTIDGTVVLDAVVENDTTGNNDKTIDTILDELQQRNTKFNKAIQDYIQRTKISHIAFLFEKCPYCGAVPVTSYNGYIPYDMTQAFFTLGRMKLLRISYQQNEQQDSKDTSTNTSNS
jgi:hypothetical protein